MKATLRFPEVCPIHALRVSVASRTLMEQVDRVLKHLTDSGFYARCPDKFSELWRLLQCHLALQKDTEALFRQIEERMRAARVSIPIPAGVVPPVTTPLARRSSQGRTVSPLQTPPQILTPSHIDGGTRPSPAVAAGTPKQQDLARRSKRSRPPVPPNENLLSVPGPSKRGRLTSSAPSQGELQGRFLAQWSGSEAYATTLMQWMLDFPDLLWLEQNDHGQVGLHIERGQLIEALNAAGLEHVFLSVEKELKDHGVVAPRPPAQRPRSPQESAAASGLEKLGAAQPLPLLRQATNIVLYRPGETAPVLDPFGSKFACSKCSANKFRCTVPGADGKAICVPCFLMERNLFGKPRQGQNAGDCEEHSTPSSAKPRHYMVPVMKTFGDPCDTVPRCRDCLLCAVCPVSNRRKATRIATANDIYYYDVKESKATCGACLRRTEFAGFAEVCCRGERCVTRDRSETMYGPFTEEGSTTPLFFCKACLAA